MTWLFPIISGVSAHKLRSDEFKDDREKLIQKDLEGSGRVSFAATFSLSYQVSDC
jgi:hypothetical protein